MSLRKLLAAATVASLLVSFDCVAADSYTVKAVLSHAGKRFAAPSAEVLAGAPATIAIDGEDGYRLALRVEQLAPDRLKVTADLVSAYGSISPVLVVHPGVAASVTAGDLGMVLEVEPKERLIAP